MLINGVINRLKLILLISEKIFFEIVEQTIKFDEPINISTKDANPVILSEEDCHVLTETLGISYVLAIKKKF